MNIIKVKLWREIPANYTGIIEWESGGKWWYKNGWFHRKDGPAVIYSDGDKEWWLNGICVWDSDFDKLDFTNIIILSKHQHPEYSTIQIWKYIDEDGIHEQIIIPGMEEYIFE